MSVARTSLLGRVVITNPMSPHTFAMIADEALASGDAASAARFVEMAYQACDESHGDPSPDMLPIQ